MSASQRIKSIYSAALPKFKKQKSLAKKYRRFSLIFLGVALTPVLSIGLFNIAIDPYGIFKSPVLSGINKAKPEKFNQDLLFKAVEITQVKPDVLYLGTSKEQWGLDPNHPAILAKKQVAYNLALQAANMYVVTRYFDHAIANNPNLKQVIIGTDFLMFNSYIKDAATFREERLGKKHISLQDFLNSVFSLDAFKTSQQTLETNLKHPHDEYIFVSRFRVKDDIYDKGRLVFDDSSKLPGSLEYFTRGMVRAFIYPTPYSFSQERLANFKSIIDTCKAKGIDVKIFIAPSHATNMEALRVQGFWSDFEQWKREITKIAPVWDFSGYNSVTTEPVSNDMKYYIDSYHYNNQAGNLVLNRLLSYQEEKVPQDFGFLMTPENIESHLLDIRKRREIWTKNNLNTVKLVEGLKHKQDLNRNSKKKSTDRQD